MNVCTCILYSFQEWALGLLHTKCTCGAIWLTNGSFKRKLDQVYQAGLRNLNLTFVVKEVAWPVIVPLSLFITLPYVVCMGLLPAFSKYNVLSKLLQSWCLYSTVLLSVSLAVADYIIVPELLVGIQ